MSNPLKQLLALLPEAPLLTGEVTAINNELRTITLPDGSVITAHGEASVGAIVFVKAGQISGPAPALTPVSIVI